MSSLRIGSNTPPSEPLGGYVDSLAKWIPGEVIAFYAAGIAAMRGTLEPLDGETEVLASVQLEADPTISHDLRLATTLVS